MTIWTVMPVAITRKGSIDECEEALGKNSTADCESGISCASKAIEKSRDDAMLYLLRAKLSFNLFVISNFQEIVNERINNCLEDCERAITITEQEITMPDSTTTKIEALQLGYLCCAKLKNKRKKDKFKQRLTEFGIDMPVNRDQIKNKVDSMATVLPTSINLKRYGFQKHHSFIHYYSRM
ncbi:uncharacterized protein [Dysidea avara]|uniref:uncharacterized protein n=1 Tax=Dysidea avara TaxID=196820 RepID=UPI00332C1686